VDDVRERLRVAIGPRTERAITLDRDLPDLDISSSRVTRDHRERATLAPCWECGAARLVEDRLGTPERRDSEDDDGDDTSERGLSHEG
jgi:hypothetical protein